MPQPPIHRRNQIQQGETRRLQPAPELTDSQMANGPVPLTKRELAEKYKVSPATIERLKSQGKIEFFQPGGPGHLVRFPHDALERLAQAPAATSAIYLNSLPTKRQRGPAPQWRRN
jgi:excisionase family DNA binding protein